MGTGLRSRSFRGPRSSYGKLQEGQLRRTLSLRQGREKCRSQALDGGPEGLEAPAEERLPTSLGDTEQLIQAQRGAGSRQWLKQYQQQVRRRWESFVASFPRVTLSQSASPDPLLDATS
uniref:Chromosome 11 open reading frame 86 n=2 Tax=Chinchilla lanigera TaxID=34839 RepID=A0A8C2W4P5_CHILA